MKNNMNFKIFISFILMCICFSCSNTDLLSGENSKKSLTDISKKIIDTSWNLSEINGKKVNISNFNTKNPVTLNFSSDVISGKAPVNQYFTSYKITENHISLEVIGATKMAGEKKYMDLEIKYLEILQKVKTIELLDENTLLLKSNTDTLIFKKAN